MNKSMSISKGAGNIKHNKRTQTVMPKNIDANRSSNNLTIIDNDIKDVYKNLFDDSIYQYNQNQKRSDRCIRDYHNKITHDKKSKLFHELVIQVGNINDKIDSNLTNDIYTDFLHEFIKTNPQLEVFGAYVHNDETTAHMHLDYVPWANYSKGLTKRVSNDKAIHQMGWGSWQNWKESQFELLEKISLNHGVNRQVMNNREKHRTVDGYKQEMRIIEKKIEVLDKIIVPEVNLTVKKGITGQKWVKFEDYSQLLQKTTLLEAHKQDLRAVNDKNDEIIGNITKHRLKELLDTSNKDYADLEDDYSKLLDENIKLKRLIIKKDQEINFYEKIIDNLKNYIQKMLNNLIAIIHEKTCDFGLNKKQEDTLTKYLVDFNHDTSIEIENISNGFEPDEFRIKEDDFTMSL